MDMPSLIDKVILPVEVSGEFRVKATSIAVLALIGLTTTACVTATQNKENMLAAAGFSVQPANTPERVASLKTLPPHKFTMQSNNGQTVFLYADPTVCGCIYYGSQQNYDAYRQMAFQQQIANQQQMTAMMNQQAEFDFGPWGPMGMGPMVPMY